MCTLCVCVCMCDRPGWSPFFESVDCICQLFPRRMSARAFPWLSEIKSRMIVRTEKASCVACGVCASCALCWKIKHIRWTHKLLLTYSMYRSCEFLYLSFSENRTTVNLFSEKALSEFAKLPLLGASFKWSWVCSREAIGQKTSLEMKSTYDVY